MVFVLGWHRKTAARCWRVAERGAVGACRPKRPEKGPDWAHACIPSDRPFQRPATTNAYLTVSPIKSVNAFLLLATETESSRWVSSSRKSIFAEQVIETVLKGSSGNTSN